MVAFSLPLRPVERPVELPEEYRKTLRNEYQVRYLESIGAAPSRANMALMRKHLPIENCKFTTAWKSRGWTQDTLYISVDPPGSSSAAAAASAARATASAAATESPTIDSVWQQLQAAEGEEEEERDDVGQRGAPRGNMRFDEARRSFLYPFKLRPAQLEQERRAAAAAGRAGAAAAGSGDAEEEEEEERGGRQEEAGRTADGFDWRSRDMHKYPLHAEEEIRAEMHAQFKLHTKDIVALQAEFVQNFPLEQLKERLSTEQLRVVLSELNGRATARFIGLLTLLLYWVHLPERTERQVAEGQLGALLCAVQTHFARVRERLKGKRTLLLTLLPLLLLSVRMACEALFRQAFPKWWTTRDAAATLQRMDAFIEQLFDPNRYHSHLAQLESSTEAIRIAARDELGVKPRAHGARFYATTTLVSTALPRGHGVWQHRHIAGPTLPPVAGQLAQLTSGAAVQQQLYQTAVHGRVDGSSSEKVLSRMIVRPEPKQKHPGSLPRTLSSGGGGVAAK